MSSSEELPPINHHSSLVAAAREVDEKDGTDCDPPDMLDTSDLVTALTRSQQIAGCSGLRRATSAPHSMDLYFNQQGQSADQKPHHPREYLPASGGPMRRVQSSLSMRRSNSFLWTPSAHHDFERVVGFLSSRGVEVSSAAITQLLRPRHPDLKLVDVDKHLRKKFLVQRRLLSQLSSQGRDLAAAPPPPSVNKAVFGAGGSAGASGCAESAALESASSAPPVAPGAPPAAPMAAVAEESAFLDACSDAVHSTASLGERMSQQGAAHRQLAGMQQQMQLSETY